MSVLDWMAQFKKPNQEIQDMRSVLGKMLFGKNDIDKSIKALSGGEKGRMLFGKCFTNTILPNNGDTLTHFKQKINIF
jgi:ATPase subunit of ABC transporter with duplicated ATPase domains